jgi:PAS domain S-box-containing protein
MDIKPIHEKQEQRLETNDKEAFANRKAEQTLKRAEQEKSAILDTLLEHVIYQDTDMKVLWANQAACNSVGMKREEVIGRHCYEVWAQRQSTCEDCPVATARDTGKSQTVEKKTPDGRWWHIEGYPLRDDSGQIVGMVELTLEITERKRAEERLEESKEFFRTVADFTYDWEHWVSPEGKYIYVSPSCERITGYTADEFLENSELLMTITHPDDKATIARHISEDLHSREVHHIDFRIITRTGHTRWISLFCRPVFSSEGHYLGRRGSSRDITDRKVAEQALRESEERYRNIVNTAHEGIYVLDADGKISFLNRQLAKMLGYRVEDMDGKLLVDFIDDLTVVETFREESANKQKKESPHDFRFRHKSNEEFWGMISSTAIYDKNGKSVGALGMVIDVTERKKAELALKNANDELKAFIDTVSHDLKNPIISIEGFSKLLLRKYGDKLDDKGRNYLEVIGAGATRMDNLVSDLLELSRIGQVAPNLKSVDCCGLVNEVVYNLRGRLEETGVELMIDQTLPTIYCDEERMHQVFENLLANAIRFAGNAEKKRIDIGYDDVGNHHRFYVRDYGVGIDPEHHRRIFHLFHRIPEEGNEDGTGLGLAIVERLVRQHDGKVWVKSERGKGASFYFILPR